MTDEKLIETVRDMDVPSAYSMSFHEAMILTNEFERLALASAAFNYGFLKGQRAAKAEAKWKKRQLSEQGRYAYLSQWLERNRGNERLLGLVERFARKMEGDEGGVIL